MHPELTEDLLMLVYGNSKHFFHFMFELLLLFYAKCAHDSCGILFLSSIFFYLYDARTFLISHCEILFQAFSLSPLFQQLFIRFFFFSLIFSISEKVFSSFLYFPLRIIVASSQKAVQLQKGSSYILHSTLERLKPIKHSVYLY